MNSQKVKLEKIHLFVQTNEGLEELLINDELFASPYFNEAIYIFEKLGERDYEKYTSIVHDDSYEQKPLETREKMKIEKAIHLLTYSDQKLF